MPEESKQELNKEQLKEKEVLTPDKIQNATALLEESTEALVAFGGFELLEMAIDGVQNLNPERKARKKIEGST